ncbi:uncharacterized protein Nmag_0508 [Natrialba magadii ATCC 43099]|uniref:DUF488 domain-containing protein n=1 Tax=Natrialba magadii (strain ATCC 43099 / DSM 3394 / CCM 3739 / CIP 104546 / IAM 13178 / JCM 8861 / NBRC 102185 / NCIMB 2190 / MS3) TaxID=547559 RepID=D3SYI4_NATMM|nr:DUF488 family protein [Natrialba magadii]ADD04095.1 uncharacterized protein Nmag_0508 [Natrialba magadii ATCC 43099]ELY33252.1 hypothetical protein C500_02949 [Natrialba magadii ATCC 43099]
MARDRRDECATEGDQREGTLTDTYVAALQHGLADVPPETTLVGVVRSPTSWFHAAVDENVPELGPPAALLDAVQTAEDDLKMRGICDEEAHNAAWDQVGFGDTYRKHLQTADDADRALESLANRLTAGESLALVCYENTEKKRCHRTILREVLESRR